MSKSSIGWRKAGISSLATAALVASACVAGASAANATTNFQLNRLSGTNRYGTSAAVAKKFTSATNAILASGLPGHYPDALTANYLAGTENAPVLLTNLDTTPPVVLQALKDLGVKNITIVGGTGVISQAQQDALAKDYNVTRISGKNRFETATDVINAGTAKSNEGIVATGLNFPDALGAGPLAYADGMPLAISKTDSISQDEIDALKAAGVTKVLIVGGTAAVSPAVQAELEANGITVDKRLSGTNRSATAEAVANYELANGFTNSAVNVASGFAQGDGADALGGGALSGANKTPMLITMDDVHPGAATLDYLTKNANTLASGWLFGGTAAVSDKAKAEMESAAQQVTSNQTYNVSGTAQNVNVSGNRTYSASGIAPNTDVTIQLFNCDNVSTGTNGQTTFTGTNPGGSGNVALPGTVSHETITVVNGTSQTTPGQEATATSDSNGDVSFTVTNDDGTAGDCVVPVVYNDANNDGFLDLNKDNTPSESFGTGGSSTFINPASQGPINSAGTQTVSNPTNSTFQEGGVTYTYDAGDQYQLVQQNGASGSVVADSYADFQKRLSTGDSVTGYYNPNGQSVFTLNDVAPAPSTNVVAVPPGTVNTKQAGKGGVEVAFTASPTSDVASYNVYRATAIQPAITGQKITCPTPANAGTTNSPQTPPGSPFTKVGSVDASAGTTSYTPAGGSAANYYTFEDTTAKAPSTSTPNNPEYCYVVTSVAATGQEGNPSDVAGPATASTATTTPTATTPMFSPTGNSATGTAGTYTIKTTYTTAAVGAVDTDGSDYTVTLNDGGAAYALKVTGATVSGDVVTITATAANGAPTAPNTGDSVIVGAKNGTDGNTVSDAQTPPTYQPVGDQVYIPTT